jgi:hypothetical protein
MVGVGMGSGSGSGSSSSSVFEDQVKALPFIQDLLDRLVRTEYSTKEIQRELADVGRKVNFILDRADHLDAGGNGSGRYATGVSADDVRALTQRLDALSTSVQHLVALQAHSRSTQKMNGTANGPSISSSHANTNQNSAHINGVSPLAPIGPNGLPIMNANGNTANNQQQSQPSGASHPAHISVNGHTGAPGSHELSSRADGFGNLAPLPGQHRNSMRGPVPGVGVGLGSGAGASGRSAQHPNSNNVHPHPHQQIQRSWSIANADMMTIPGSRRESEITVNGNNANVNGGMSTNGSAMIRDKRKMSLNITRRDSISVSAIFAAPICTAAQ